jgi:hypothetical protein
MRRKIEEKLGERKNCRNQENVAKHAVRLSGWHALQSDEETSQMPFVPNGTQGYTTITTTTTTTSTTTTIK